MKQRRASPVRLQNQVKLGYKFVPAEQKHFSRGWVGRGQVKLSIPGLRFQHAVLWHGRKHSKIHRTG